MKHTYVLFCLLTLTLSCFATEGKGRKATFAAKDVFQSAVFLPNNGLINDYNTGHIQYYANHDHLVMFFTEQGVIYRVSALDKKRVKEIAKEKGEKEKPEEEGIPIVTSTVTMQWLGANPHPVIESGMQAEGYHSFMQKVDTGFVSVMAQGYRTLTYRDLYPGIDVVYSFPDKGGVKYDLILKPGADPSVIKMNYGGAIKKIRKDATGNVVITSQSGSIEEHAPLTFTADHQPVASAFSVQGNEVRFDVTGQYDRSKGLTIDPWVVLLTNLPPTNMGFNVDYDFTGNLFVYGAGATGSFDFVNYHQIAKFNQSGGHLWTFDGSVAAIRWSTMDTNLINYASNFIVDKNSGKAYTGQGYYGDGCTSVRIDQNGLYDNFVSNRNSLVQETWCFAYNCTNNAILSIGGGTTSNLNMGVINTVTGVTTTSNITGLAGTGQDIGCATYDSAGSLYVLITANVNYTNAIYKVNSTYTGNLWGVNSNYTSFSELYQKPFWYTGPSANGFNCLSANGSYLYYYDGYNVAAYSLATGAPVGTATTISGYNVKYQGGIAVDYCNNVYVGGQGVIKTFTFNGSTFTPGADIPLGVGFNSDAIYDVKYDAANNLIYVTGGGIVGTYTAPLSANCSVISSFSSSVTTNCTGAIVHVVPGVGNLVFSYLWQDSTGTIVKQTSPGTHLYDTLTGVAPGRYTVQIQLNVNCGGATSTDSFTIISCNNLVHSPDTTICAGQSVILSATGVPTGGAYLWTPGGATTSSITVSPAATTRYVVSYTPPTGPVQVDSILVTVVHSATVTVADTVACSGQSVSLTAVPSIGGGTYVWAPGGAVTQTISVSPLTSTTYTVTYSSGTCGNAVDSGVVRITPRPTLTVPDTTLCIGQPASLTAHVSIAGGTYLWSPGAIATQTITASPTTNTTYTVIYTLTGCQADTATGTMHVTSAPTVSAGVDTTICSGGSAVLTAVASAPGGSYAWSPGGGTTQSITVSPASTNTYTVTYSLPGCGSVTATKTVNIDPAISVSLSVTDPPCFGQTNGLIISNIQPANNYTYNWSNSVTTVNDSNLAGGTYRLTVTDAIGCSVVDSATVVVPAAATLYILPSDTTVLQGNSVQLGSVFGGYPVSSIVSYSWTPTSGLSCDTCANPLVTTGPTSDTMSIYTLTVMYNNGCVVTAKDTVQMEYIAISAIPNAFTPNGDGHNDFYMILAKGVTSFNLTIYNRWGQLVFASADITQGWDGNYGGSPQPAEDYTFFFTVTYQNGKTENHTGTMTLMR